MRRVLVHLDTDFGGDLDDACALGLLLSLDDVEIAGVTPACCREPGSS